MYADLIEHQLLRASVLDLSDTNMVVPDALTHRVATGYVYHSPPPHPTFDVAPEVIGHAREVVTRGQEAHAAWQKGFDAWARANPDGAALRLNDSARISGLERFLRASRTRRIFLVLHDVEHVQRNCPRMMSLLARFSHAVQINRSSEEIRELQDAFLVLDALHYVRRPVASYFRGAIGLGDETEGLGMRSRFMEIWAASIPAVSSTTLGL